MSNQKLEIEQQMEKAGTQSITPTFIRLDGTRVMLSDKMKSEEFLLKINGTPCFPRCDVSSISGGAKTGKTTLITLLILCALLCNKFMEKLGFSRVSEIYARFLEKWWATRTMNCPTICCMFSTFVLLLF